MKQSVQSYHDQMTTGELIVRFLTSTAILWVTAFFTPTFEITSLFSLFVVAIVLTIFDYLLNSVFMTSTSSLGRGIIAFFTCAIILYLTQFFLDDYRITLLSSLIGALIYAMVASIISDKQIS